MVLVSLRRSLRKLGCSVLKVIFNHCWCRKWYHRIIQGTSLNHTDVIVNFTSNGAFCFCYKDVYLLIHVQKHEKVGLFKIFRIFQLSLPQLPLLDVPEFLFPLVPYFAIHDETQIFRYMFMPKTNRPLTNRGQQEREACWGVPQFILRITWETSHTLLPNYYSVNAD